MMHKQVTMRCIKLCRSQSWRRSNQALFLFSLLLVPTYTFSADPRRASASASQGKQEDTSYGSGKELFHGETIEAIESVYQDAPFLAKQIIMYLKNPKVLKGMDC